MNIKKSRYVFIMYFPITTYCSLHGVENISLLGGKVDGNIGVSGKFYGKNEKRRFLSVVKVARSAKRYDCKNTTIHKFSSDPCNSVCGVAIWLAIEAARIM
jgi:hypothetical protein